MIPSHVSLKLHEIERALSGPVIEVNAVFQLGWSPCCNAEFVARYDDCGCVFAGCPTCGDDTYPVLECREHRYDPALERP